jgi:putative hydrolase of the HAD superfamily
MNAVIFDLDNCLCAASAVGEDLFAPVFAAVRDANRAGLDESVLQRAFSDCWHTSFDVVAKRYGFSNEMIEAGYTAFAALEVTSPLTGYPDLSVVRELPIRRYLVTTGFRRLQESKIRALGIDAWFERVIVDAIDEAEHPGKQSIFETILTGENCLAEKVLVVGDNPSSELAAGRNIGMVTVQTLRPGVTHWAGASHHIRSLDELWPLIRRAD